MGDMVSKDKQLSWQNRSIIKRYGQTARDKKAKTGRWNLWKCYFVQMMLSELGKRASVTQCQNNPLHLTSSVWLHSHQRWKMSQLYSECTGSGQQPINHWITEGFSVHVNKSVTILFTEFFCSFPANLPLFYIVLSWPCGHGKVKHLSCFQLWGLLQVHTVLQQLCGCVKWHPSLAALHLTTQQLSQRVCIQPTTTPGVAF